MYAFGGVAVSGANTRISVLNSDININIHMPNKSCIVKHIHVFFFFLFFLTMVFPALTDMYSFF